MMLGPGGVNTKNGFGHTKGSGKSNGQMNLLANDLSGINVGGVKIGNNQLQDNFQTTSNGKIFRR
jgi:hypothetical protein